MEKEKDISLLTELETYCQSLLLKFENGAAIGLSGNLGSGKTTFVKLFINVIYKKPLKVISPSFVIHQSYNTIPPVEHFDFYRLENVGFSDLTELAYYERYDYCRSNKGFIFVEWPEKVSDMKLLNLEYLLKLKLKDLKRYIELVPLSF